MTRPSMNNSVILASRHNIIMISENMIKGRIISQRTYLGFAGGGTLTITTCSGADGVTMMLLMERSKQDMTWTEDEPWCWALPKNYILPLTVGSGDMISRSLTLGME